MDVLEYPTAGLLKGWEGTQRVPRLVVGRAAWFSKQEVTLETWGHCCAPTELPEHPLTAHPTPASMELQETRIIWSHHG